MFKNTIKSAVVAMAIVSAGVAQATPSVNVGTYDFGALSGSGVNVLDVLKAGKFEDTITFSIDSGNAGEIGLVSLFPETFAKKGFSTFTFKLMSGSNEIASVGDGWKLGFGSYSLFVSGTAKKDGGSYAFSYDVAAVPEPESYAMFLAGLGVMGAVARRRSRKN